MTTTKKAEVLLGKYAHDASTQGSALACGGGQARKQRKEAWLTSDAEALGIFAQGVELHHQTKIRSEASAM
ncbi:polyprotein [Phytophthora megakarya]|uniref:Polyprotein n=1 Tax=Phytophthora megakarya TaxID=4795 RepID=A0A225X292_9STRA|nr:polyprotein [Phytophthora megakarya]